MHLCITFKHFQANSHTFEIISAISHISHRFPVFSKFLWWFYTFSSYFVFFSTISSISPWICYTPTPELISFWTNFTRKLVYRSGSQILTLIKICLWNRALHVGLSNDFCEKSQPPSPSCCMVLNFNCFFNWHYFFIAVDINRILVKNWNLAKNSGFYHIYFVSCLTSLFPSLQW